MHLKKICTYVNITSFPGKVTALPVDQVNIVFEVSMNGFSEGVRISLVSNSFIVYSS